MFYRLPTDRAILSWDPLGIQPTDDPPQVDVLSELIEAALSRLACGSKAADVMPGLVQDIVYTVHREGTLDTSYLQEFLSQSDRHTHEAKSLLHAAQTLATYFPESYIETLEGQSHDVNFCGTQVNAILAHQFLGSMSIASGVSWGRPDFTAWYSSNPAHKQAVDGYMATVLDHFHHGGYSQDQEFGFSLYTAEFMPDPSQCKSFANITLHVVHEESEPSGSSETSFCLVAANSEPGPGASATQEERLQAASPVLCLSAIVIPKLRDDEAVITSAFPVHAEWKGHNRTARMERLFSPDERPKRHYVLADALPLDDVEDEGSGLKDLQHGRVAREVRKLYAAFSGAWNTHWNTYGCQSKPCIVECGAWGCGAFGGNLLVKTVCMMIAAGMTGIEFHYTLLENRNQDVVLVRYLLERRFLAAELWKALMSSNTLSDVTNILGIAVKL